MQEILLPVASLHIRMNSPVPSLRTELAAFATSSAAFIQTSTLPHHFRQFGLRGYYYISQKYSIIAEEGSEPGSRIGDYLIDSNIHETLVN